MVSNEEEMKIKETKIMEAQSKYKPGQMHPDPSILHHPAFVTLWQYTMEGCPVDCRELWTREHIEVAIH